MNGPENCSAGLAVCGQGLEDGRECEDGDCKVHWADCALSVN
jgi:hypothetical protein